jgi:hypothetical protein
LDTLGNIWIITESHGAAIFNPNGVEGFDCIDNSLQSCTSTGINEIVTSTISSSEIYPNPVSSFTILELNTTIAGSAIISFQDVTGREIKHISIPDLKSGINKIEIDLSDFKNGIYLLNLSQYDKTETLKVIKN